MKATRKIQAFTERHRLHFFKYIGIFVLILLGFHFLYVALIDENLVIPGLEGLYFYLQHQLFLHSAWVVENLWGYDIVREGHSMRFATGGGIVVDESCSAVKWFAHFLVLMILFPGPWKHKAWFIPAGLAITHLVNIIRVSGLAVVYVHRPENFEFFHDYIFRPFFYFVLFILWVAWVEWFFLPSRKKKANGFQD